MVTSDKIRMEVISEQQSLQANNRAVCAAGQSDQTSAILDRAMMHLREMGPEFSGNVSTLDELTNRLASGRFHLAVLGQFKRGKSTLLNALLGEAVLPVSVIPLTSIPTFISAGPTRHARIIFRDSRAPVQFSSGDASAMSAFLAQYVTEADNPHNHLGVSEVELSHPAPILRHGLVLIDTPGIGSTFRHNTDATLSFLPQCDAAVFLVSADPPITEVEIEFLKHVRAGVTRLFFVLNKADYLTDDERQQALQFLKSVLTEQGFSPEVVLFPVSARLGLQSKLEGETAKWAQSGLDRVEAHLVEFLAREKNAVLTNAIARKSADVLANVLLRLNLTLQALRLPLEELQKRLAIFEQKLAEIDRERLTAKDLLAGDKRRMHQMIEAEYARVISVAETKLEESVQAAMADRGSPVPTEDTMHEALGNVVPDLFGGLFMEVTKTVEDRLAEVLRPHQERANALIESIRRTAAEVFKVPFQAAAHMPPLDRGRTPYWQTHRWEPFIGPIPTGFIDKLLPRSFRRLRVEKRFRGKVESVTLRNAGELREAMSNRLDKAFSHYERELDRLLQETTTATHGAIRAVMINREKQAAAVSDESPRLTAAVVELAALKAELEATAILSTPISGNAIGEGQLA